MNRTAMHRLADMALGDEGPLGTFVAAQRADDRSWRRISRAIYEATDGTVEISHETLRLWFAASETTEAAS